MLEAACRRGHFLVCTGTLFESCYYTETVLQRLWALLLRSNVPTRAVAEGAVLCLHCIWHVRGERSLACPRG